MTTLSKKPKGEAPKVYTLEDAGALLRAWQINEWQPDKRMTKKAIREQRQIIERLLVALTQRDIAEVELDHVIGGLN